MNEWRRKKLKMDVSSPPMCDVSDRKSLKFVREVANRILDCRLKSIIIVFCTEIGRLSVRFLFHG